MTTGTDAPERTTRSSPNVLLVMTDDQGYGDVSRHGNPELETPEIDRLHREGIEFDDFHVCPTCSPTRAALMTGRHNLRTGVWHTVRGRNLLDPAETTMADAFSAAGYRTGIFGKWHLGDNYPFRPQDRGFDETVIHGGGAVNNIPDYWGNDDFDDTYFRNGEPESFEGYCTDVWVEEALSFVASCAEDGDPFFCYVPTNAPHGPLHAPEAYQAPYDHLPDGVARYYGMLANLDENLGRLRRGLEDCGVAEDTIVIFLTDNGASQWVTRNTDYELYNAGMRGWKGSVYEGGHRVPAVVHWPGEYGGGRVDALAAGYDLFPTLVDLCGLSAPDVDFDGRTLRPLLEDADGWDDDRRIVVDSQRQEHPEPWNTVAVLTEQWRLVHGDELYDIKADPGQENDVAEDHPDVVADLRATYEEWWEGLPEGFDGYRRTVVGGEEDPCPLTAMDWHDSDGLPPVNQRHVIAGQQSEGFWTVDVAEAGTYEIAIRRWPAEIDVPIGGVPDSLDAFERFAASQDFHAAGELERIDPESAHVRIDDEVDHSTGLSPGDTAVSFELHLDAGPAALRAWFVDDEGASWGAYYADVSGPL